MILALAGNPNCGKTTLFNALTGANARTGNFPGVTVTRSTGVCRAQPDVTLVDLPGVQSASSADRHSHRYHQPLSVPTQCCYLPFFDRLSGTVLQLQSQLPTQRCRFLIL